MRDTFYLCNYDTDISCGLVVVIRGGQGPRQPHSHGWTRVSLSSNFHNFFLFSSNFPHFCPYFGLPGWRLAAWKTLATPLELVWNITRLQGVLFVGHILESVA